MGVDSYTIRAPIKAAGMWGQSPAGKQNSRTVEALGLPWGRHNSRLVDIHPTSADEGQMITPAIKPLRF